MVKPEPKLSDMPPHIKQSIVDDSDTKTKLSLRRVNKQFKEIVEKSVINYERLTLSLNFNKVELVWQKTRTEAVTQVFEPTDKEYVMRKESETIKTGEGDYRKAAVAEMLSVFEYSKVTVGELLLEISHSDIRGRNDWYEHTEFKEDRAVIFARIRRILSPKNFRLKVAKLKIRLKVSEWMLLSLLQYFEPGILKVLDSKCQMTISRGYVQHQSVSEQITDTDQWRQLKEVNIEGFKLDVPFEKCLHLEKLSLRFSRSPTETMKAFLEIVLQKATMKRCWVSCGGGGFDMTGAEEYLDQFEKNPERSTDYRTCIKHPYEEGKRAEIDMNMFTVSIEKFDY